MTDKIPKLDPDGTLPRLPGWISLTRAAEMLGISRQHAYRMARDGAFNSLRRVDDSFIFVVSEVEVSNMREKRDGSEN